MTLRDALRRTYGGGTAFLIACPLLALVPVLFEIVQHVVEVRIGMYDSLAAAKAVEHDPWRMGFGLVKVIALLVPIYWVTRFLPRRDARFAATLDGTALRLFGGVFAFRIALVLVQMFVLPQTLTAALTGFLAAQVIACLMAAWGVAATLGNAAVGPRASVAIMRRQLPWTFVFFLAALLPVMVPHYLLGALAILGPKPLLWPVLILDSLLVGWLIAVLIASEYYAAVRAAAGAGVDLHGAHRAQADVPQRTGVRSAG